MTEGERVAKLEARSEEIVRRLGSQDADLHAIRADVREIKESMSRFRGFAAGVVFAVSIASGLVGALIAIVWRKLGG